MTLDEDRCRALLAAADHGVLATLHPRRGPDPVPVVLAVDDDRILIPVDTVKAKSGRRLRRLENLRADPRCAVLVDHYDDDWSTLWWVRAAGVGTEVDPSDDDLALLADRFPQYRTPGTVAGLIIVTIDEVTGWTADP